MKKRNYFYKKLLVHGLVLSLIQTQTFNFAYAATSASDVGQAINIVGGIGQSILAQKQQLQMQQMAMIQAQNIQKQMQPKLTPSKYFPECKLPQAMSAVPQNACMPTNNPQQMQSLYSYEAAAANMVNYFDQMLNDVANSNLGIGVSCMNNAQKVIDNQLTEMINNLTRLQTQLKEESQQFREANKPLISQLEETNTELMGTSDRGSSSNSVTGKTRDFTKLVSPECQKVVGNGFSALAESNGFNGLLKATSGKNQSANAYNASRGQIESEIRSQVQKLKDSIASNGLDYWSSQDQNGYGRGQQDLADKLSSYPSLATIMQRERTNLLSQVSRISRDLKKFNYDMPTLDKDASSNLSSDISSVQADLKRKFVNSCVTNSSKGVAIDFDKVLSSIRQEGTENSQFALTGYKTALQNIMNSDDDIATKLEKIKALESTYQGMSVSYTNFGGSKTTETPFQLFTKTLNNCQNKFDSDFASDAKKVQASLQELKNITDSFPSTMGSKIVDTMINCNGESLKATDSCNEDTLNPAKQQSFCMAKASTCANNMNSCYNEINTAVETRKTKMNNISKQFNANVQTMVSRANTLYKSQQANITALTKLIQARFPGSNFEIPKDMFITLPETTKDKYGVEVAMNGDINKIIEELPSKMELLKQMFGNQKEAADKEMGEYISLQQKNIEKEKGKFLKMQADCSRAANDSAQAIAKANEAGQKAQAELDGKVKSFCRKYDNLRNSPMPSCDDAKKLADDIDGVASRLTSQTSQLAMSYASTCNQYNNESSDRYTDCMDSYDDLKGAKKKECDRIIKKFEQDTNSKGKKTAGAKSFDLAKVCKSKSTSNDDFVNNSLGLLSKADKEKLPKKADIVKAFKDGNFDSFKDVDNSFFQKLTAEFSDLNLGKDGANICEALLAKSEKSSKETQDSIESGKKEIADAKEKLASETDDAKKKELEASIKKKEEAIATLEDNAKKSGKQDLNDKLTAMLKDEDSEDADSTISDPKSMAFKRLGEQATGSCDAESNATVAKNPLFFDINSYDKQKGVGGVSQ